MRVFRDCDIGNECLRGIVFNPFGVPRVHYIVRVFVIEQALSKFIDKIINYQWNVPAENG